MASPDDSAKPILALPEVNAALSAHYFNWSSWPNMGDRGQPPMLRRYRYEDLVAGGKPVPVGDTGLSVTAYPLSHGGSLSTAFLIRSGEDALLCMGDTGPDAVEHSARLEALWQAIAPLVRAGRLRAIIVETSYPDPRKDTELYGHLTPKWLRAELGRLAAAAGGADGLKGLPVVIGHIKPSIDGAEPAVSAIMRQLAEGGSPPCATFSQSRVKPWSSEAGRSLRAPGFRTRLRMSRRRWFRERAGPPQTALRSGPRQRSPRQPVPRPDSQGRGR